MNLQHENIIAYCEKLNLTSIANSYSKLAETAAKEDLSYSAFLENILKSEIDTKHTRRKILLAKIGY